jgi:hypothetical protein
MHTFFPACCFILSACHLCTIHLVTVFKRSPICLQILVYVHARNQVSMKLLVSAFLLLLARHLTPRPLQHLLQTPHAVAAASLHATVRITFLYHLIHLTKRTSQDPFCFSATHVSAPSKNRVNNSCCDVQHSMCMQGMIVMKTLCPLMDSVNPLLLWWVCPERLTVPKLLPQQ